MAITVYHYPACSTCRRALKWLAEREISYELVHIVDQPPARAALERALRQSELPIRSLFNTSGQSYRAGNYKERLASMSKEEALAALAADGKLIKRPLVLGAGIALVGFDEAAWSQALG